MILSLCCVQRVRDVSKIKNNKIMKKSTFWSDASHCGAVVGLVNIAFSALSMLMPKLSFILGLANMVLTIYLLFYYSRRRASLFSQEGFTYGQALVFMLASGIFLGILTGAYQIVATNWLFPAQFEKTFDEMLMAISQIGISGAELDEMMEMYRSMIFSPLPSLLTNIFSGVLTAGFYGLFIAIGVKREPDLFDTEEDDEE